MSSSISYRRKLRSHTSEPIEDNCDSTANTEKPAKTIVTGFTNNREIHHEGQGQHMTDIERCDLPSSNILPAEESSESQNCNSLTFD